jgi:flagellar assembly protein FliH
LSDSRLLRSTQRADEVLLDIHGRIVDERHVSTDAAETEDAASIVDEARRHAEELTRSAASQAAAVQHDAYDEGRMAGYRDGVALARGELADALAHVQRAGAQAKTVRDELMRGMEREIIELVVDAAGHVLGEQVQIDPSIAAATVQRALERAGSQNVVGIRVNPGDLQVVSVSLGERHGDAAPFEVRGDNSVSVGGCIIDTAAGEIDARLDVQLSEVARVLREGIPEPLTPPPPADSGGLDFTSTEGGAGA